MSKRLFVMPVILITIVLGSFLLAYAQQQPPPRQPGGGDRQQGQPLTIVLGSFLLAYAQQQPPPRQPGDGDRQQMQPRQPRPPDDPLADDMFPPEMIMQHQRELALSDAQKTFMLSEMQRTNTRFTELNWQLQYSMEALHETMKANQVNEQLALAQLNKVLDAEREIKTLHMGMAIRIKNQLSPDQQMKLQTMRNTFQPDGQRRDRRPGGPDGPGKPRPGGPDGMRPGGPPGPGGPGGAGPRPPGGGRPGGPGL
jgi:Spy/CpxP family protein refolding chaperone